MRVKKWRLLKVMGERKNFEEHQWVIQKLAFKSGDLIFK